MSETFFDLVILNHSSDKSVESLVQDLLIILNKAGDPYLEYKLSEALLFEQSNSAVLNQVTRVEGEEYQEKFRELRVETELRPTLQMVAKEAPEPKAEEDQYVCPVCDHAQPKQKDPEVMDSCDYCGRVGEKLEKHKRKEEIFEIEKRKLQNEQKQQLAEATERAHYEEAEEMRQEARQKLGIVKNKKSVVGILASLSVVSLVGASAYFLTSSDRNGKEVETSSEKLAASDADKTDSAKPAIIIQGGGSITINNAEPSTVTNNGKGGAKGVTGTEVETAQTDGAATSSNNDNTGTGTKPATGTVAQGNPEQAIHDSKLASTSKGEVQEKTTAKSSGTQTITATNSTTSSNIQSATPTTAPGQKKNTAIQLAALTPQTTDVKSARAAATAIAKPVANTVAAAITPEAELKLLKAILHSEKSHDHSANLFSKVNKKQFIEHKKRLHRLLNLGKPSLALIFAEGVDDAYAASLLLLEVVKHEKKATSTAMHDELLSSMKGLINKGESATETAMLNAGLSQVYHFTGDTESAKKLLQQSMHTLHAGSAAKKHQCHLLAQMSQNHRDFNKEGSESFYNSALINFVTKLPKKENVQAARIYTHLAAAALHDKNKDEANAWLKQIPAQDAQQHLLAQLKTLVATADK